MLNANVGMTRTAAAPESSAPVTPRSREDFADTGTAAPVAPPAPVISAQEQQMLKELVSIMNQALADSESQDAKLAEAAAIAIGELSIFALGFLEGKGILPSGYTFIGNPQQPPINLDNKVDFIKKLIQLLEELQSTTQPVTTRVIPLVYVAVAAFSGGAGFGVGAVGTYMLLK
jgi:hypothetical protein